MCSDNLHELNLLYTFEIDPRNFSYVVTRHNTQNLDHYQTREIHRHGNKIEEFPVFWKKVTVPIDFRKIHVYDNDPVYLFTLNVNKNEEMWEELDFKLVQKEELWTGLDFKLVQIEDTNVPYEITDDWLDNNEHVHLAPVTKLFSESRSTHWMI
jgi:hypothetical protein